MRPFVAAPSEQEQQSLISDNGTTDQIIQFVKNNPNAVATDIMELQASFMRKVYDISDVIEFATYAHSPDITPMQNRVLERGSGWQAYCFAKDVRGADINALQKVVLERGDGFDALAFARDIVNADVHRLQRRVMCSGSANCVLGFAYVNGAHIADIQWAIVAIQDGWCAYYLARDTLGVDVNALQDVVLSTSDAILAMRFAQDVVGANIPALQDIVEQCGSGADILNFATGVPYANISRLQDAVIHTEDAKSIYTFARLIPESDLSVTYNRLVELKALGKDNGYLADFHRNETIQSRLKADGLRLDRSVA